MEIQEQYNKCIKLKFEITSSIYSYEISSSQDPAKEKGRIKAALENYAEQIHILKELLKQDISMQLTLNAKTTRLEEALDSMNKDLNKATLILLKQSTKTEETKINISKGLSPEKMHKQIAISNLLSQAYQYAGDAVSVASNVLGRVKSQATKMLEISGKADDLGRNISTSDSISGRLLSRYKQDFALFIGLALVFTFALWGVYKLKRKYLEI